MHSGQRLVVLAGNLEISLFFFKWKLFWNFVKKILPFVFIETGQAFKAHRAVLAASSLYFRDLFSSSTKTQFELPSSVTPACFEQILTFCYTGKLTMAASEQLVVMYTAGYLQIQHIVEKGMDLMFKANSPHCDSQTAGSLEETGSEPQSPCNNGNGLAVAALLGTPGWSPSLLLPRKIKLESGDPTPLTIPSTQSKISSSEQGSRLSRVSSLFYTTAGGTPFPGIPPLHLHGASGGGTGGGGGAVGERSSPGASSLPTTDSPTSYQNEDEEFEEEPYDGITEEAYGHLYPRSHPYGSEYCVIFNANSCNTVPRIGQRHAGEDFTLE